MSAIMPSTMMGAQAARGIADSTIETMTTRTSRKAVAAAVAGNAFELFGFLTYVLFAVYIGKAFFPASTPLTSLLLSLAAFGVGFASHLIGAILMGAYADRAGRKPALLFWPWDSSP